MNMIEAVGTCFRKYFSFRGRARRSEYWYWILFTILASIVLSVLDLIIFPGLAAQELGPLDTILTLITFIPGLAVTWRRLHDTDRSGWWYGGPILALIPIGAILGFLMLSMGAIDTELFVLSDDMTGGRWIPLALLVVFVVVWFILILAFTIQDSSFGPNKYGDNPKGDGNASVFD